MGVKRWNKYPNEKLEQMCKDGTITNEMFSQQKGDIEHLSTHVAWLDKHISGFSLSIYRDDENEVGIYFTIPYLFMFEHNKRLTTEAFKQRYPEMKDYDQHSWGFHIGREHVSLYWNHLSHWDLDLEKGFSWTKSWSEILKGEVKKITTKPSIPILVTTDLITSNYRKEWYDENGIQVYPSDEKGSDGYFDIPVIFQVRKKVYTRHYSRWFSKSFFTYEICMSNKLIVPGKGENSWDCDDEVIESVYDKAYDHCSFSIGSAKSPLEAVSKVKEIIYRQLNRG